MRLSSIVSFFGKFIALELRESYIAFCKKSKAVYRVIYRSCVCWAVKFSIWLAGIEYLLNQLTKIYSASFTNFPLYGLISGTFAWPTDDLSKFISSHESKFSYLSDLE